METIQVCPIQYYHRCCGLQSSILDIHYYYLCHLFDYFHTRDCEMRIWNHHYTTNDCGCSLQDWDKHNTTSDIGGSILNAIKDVKSPCNRLWDEGPRQSFELQIIINYNRKRNAGGQHTAIYFLWKRQFNIMQQNHCKGGRKKDPSTKWKWKRNQGLDLMRGNSTDSNWYQQYNDEEKVRGVKGYTNKHKFYIYSNEPSNEASLKERKVFDPICKPKTASKLHKKFRTLRKSVHIICSNFRTRREN